MKGQPVYYKKITDLIKDYGPDRIVKVMDKVPYGKIALRFYGGNTQRAMAREFGVRQPSIGNLIVKSIRNAKAMLSMPDINHQQMENDIKPVLGELWAKVVCNFLKTSSQSATARHFDRSQGWVRYVIMYSLNRMENEPNMVDYVRAIKITMDNVSYTAVTKCGGSVEAKNNHNYQKAK